MTTTSIKSLPKSYYKNTIAAGIDYDTYKRQMAEDLALNPDLKIKEYINLNQRRMYRIEKTYTISAGLAQQAINLKNKSFWLILTEHWCGDASQILPALRAIAALSNGQIEMKLVYRDQNDDLMNAYLTNGTRSIPKLIQLNEHFNVTGIWGPRPSVAQKLVKDLKANPATAANYSSELHLWYAKNKQQDLEKDVAQLLFRANLFCADCLS